MPPWILIDTFTFIPWDVFKDLESKSLLNKIYFLEGYHGLADVTNLVLPRLWILHTALENPH